MKKNQKKEYHLKEYIPSDLSDEELEKALEAEKERCKQLTEWPNPFE